MDGGCFWRRLCRRFRMIWHFPDGGWMHSTRMSALTFFWRWFAMELLERYGNGIWEKLVLTAVFCTLTEAAGADGGAWGWDWCWHFIFV